MVKPILVTALLLCSFTFVGCSYLIPSGTQLDSEVLQHKEMQDLQSRASFDLDCPKEDIDYTTLEELQFNPAGSHVGAVIGASGCDQRAVYMMGGYGWQLDSTRQ